VGGFVGYFGMLMGGPDVSDVRRLCQLLWLAEASQARDPGWWDELRIRSSLNWETEMQ
jgi:hypothetical protein